MEMGSGAGTAEDGDDLQCGGTGSTGAQVAAGHEPKQNLLLQRRFGTTKCHFQPCELLGFSFFWDNIMCVPHFLLPDKMM